jgi:hypothetical protein
MLKQTVVTKALKFKAPIVSYEEAKKEGGVFNELGDNAHDKDFLIFTPFGMFYYNGCYPSGGLQSVDARYAARQTYRKANVEITVTLSNV